MIDFTTLAAECSPDVHPKTIQAVVRTESGYNPFAIGVVGGHLSRQPQNINEAIKTAKMLEQAGYNYSLGLLQINKNNMHKYGLTLASVFSPCPNLKAGADILKNCYSGAQNHIDSSQKAVLASLSCYYSGNYVRGFIKDSGNSSYVQRVVNSAVIAKNENPVMAVPEIASESPTPDAITVKPAATPETKSNKDQPFVATPAAPAPANVSKKHGWDVFGDFSQ